jgi:hypothetical protein
MKSSQVPRKSALPGTAWLLKEGFKQFVRYRQLSIKEINFNINILWLKRIKSGNPVCLLWFACYIWPLCVVFNTTEGHVFKSVSLKVKMVSDMGSVKFAPVGAV